MIYKKWKMAFSHESFDEVVQKALKDFNIPTIESLTPYQLKKSVGCFYLLNSTVNFLFAFSANAI